MSRKAGDGVRGARTGTAAAILFPTPAARSGTASASTPDSRWMQTVAGAACP